jgi:hypothetical protein
MYINLCLRVMSFEYEPYIVFQPFVCLRSVSCVPSVARGIGLSILDCPFSFLMTHFRNNFLLLWQYSEATFHSTTYSVNGQKNVRENWRGNQEWTIQCLWQHLAHRTQNENIVTVYGNESLTSLSISKKRYGCKWTWETIRHYTKTQIKVKEKLAVRKDMVYNLIRT